MSEQGIQQWLQCQRYTEKITCEVSILKIESGRIIESIIEKLDQMEYVKSSEIPNIDLYMDQVLTFMNGHLENIKRYESDKVLTKTMINNYAKNHLVPAPDRKKYSKEHLLVLMFICYFKNFLSIGDIQSILAPLTEKYFQKGNGLNLEDIYEEVFSLEADQIESLKVSLKRDFERAGETFSEESEEDKEYLQLFSFICMMSYDIYIRKQIIEQLIDEFPKQLEENNKKM